MTVSDRKQRDGAQVPVPRGKHPSRFGLRILKTYVRGARLPDEKELAFQNLPCIFSRWTMMGCDRIQTDQ